MKKLSLLKVLKGSLILFTLLIQTVSAQAPHKMSYQAIIRNANNELIRSSTIRTKISVILGSATGQAVYSEWQTQNTDTNGLLSLKIGEGNVLLGDIQKINWGDGSYYIKTETDPTGGTNFSLISSVELMSVPYALYSYSGLKGDKGDTGLQGLQGVKGDKGDTGLQGVQGLKGDTGLTGAKGDIGLQGVQGIKGDTGLTGAKGDIGLQGLQGLKGDTGLTGAKGEKGAIGGLTSGEYRPKISPIINVDWAAGSVTPAYYFIINDIVFVSIPINVNPSYSNPIDNCKIKFSLPVKTTNPTQSYVGVGALSGGGDMLFDGGRVDLLDDSNGVFYFGSHSGTSKSGVITLMYKL